MKLADLIDLEMGCLLDRSSQPDELRSRDRELGRTLVPALSTERPGTPAFRRRLFLGWLDRRRSSTPELFPGHQIESAYRTIGWVLAILGLVSGSSTASLVLHFDGTTPVNVVHFLAVFVFLQLGLLLLFPATVLIWRRGERQGGLFGFYSLLRWLGERLSRGSRRLLQKLPGDRRQNLLAAQGQIRSLVGVHLPAEKWLLLELQKRFGLAFNLGALATSLYLIAFSDLAFAWSTTLDLDSQAFHSLVSIVAAPWSWVLDQGSPSLEMVEASRYFRLDGSYLGAGPTAQGADPILVGGWWAFLLLSLAVYGLLPRLLLWITARLKFRSALRHVSLRHGDFDALYERLVLPVVTTRAREPERGVTIPATVSPTGGQAGLDQWPAIPAAVAVWGDIPVAHQILEELLEGRFGWEVKQMVQAGVLEHEIDSLACQSLQEAKRQGVEVILLLAESFEPPTRELMKFLRKLRESVGLEFPLVVGLFDLQEPQAPTHPAGGRPQGSPLPASRSGKEEPAQPIASGLEERPPGGEGPIEPPLVADRGEPGTWIPPGEEDWHIWHTKLAALGDPYLRVERLVEDT
ncbi:MAG: DUF2868 domain-containing protein [Bradymonadales bacterium]|nr:DUF2868 domain-containing protein [Bradymonadales bacterium]